MFIIRWLLKLSGIFPSLFVFNPKKYYLGKKLRTENYHGPLIVVENHRSFMDYITICRMFYFRRIHVVVSELLYEHKFIRFLLKAMGVIRADRFSGDPAFINESIAVLKKGGILLIYPESKIETEDEIYEFKRSVGLISLHSGAPILPIYHEGDIGPFHREKCILGDLIYPYDHAKEDNTVLENADAITAAVYASVCNSKKLYREMFFSDGKKKAQADRMNLLGRYVTLTGGIAMQTLITPKKIYESDYAKLYYHNHRKRAIVMSNHTWWIDGPLQYWLMPHRKFHVLTAKDVCEANKARAVLMRSLNGIFLNRDTLDLAALRSCVEVLNQEGQLLIFPEGKISHTGEIDAFANGIFTLLAMVDAPIIPVYLSGLYAPFHRTKVVIGEPMYFNEKIAKEGKNTVVLDEIANEVRNKIIALSDLYQPSEKEIALKEKHLQTQHVRMVRDHQKQLEKKEKKK